MAEIQAEVSKSTWFRTWPARDGRAEARLVCFPHAGVGASLCNGWSESLAGNIELMAVQLPGRENRLQETPLREFGPLKHALQQILPNYLDLPMGLFGYSFGGTFAYELARGMVEYGVAPSHLFVGAAVAPQLPRNLEPISELPDEQFVAELQANFGGIPPQIAGQQELLQMMLPALRADMHAIESYKHVPGEPLPCPITAFAGSEDTVISMAEMSAWSQQTAARFRHRVFPGDHFFIRDRYHQVMQYVSAQMTEHITVAT